MTLRIHELLLDNNTTDKGTTKYFALYFYYIYIYTFISLVNDNTNQTKTPIIQELSIFKCTFMQEL